MEIGMVQILASFGLQGVSDQQVYDEEVRQAVLADELDYDHLWVVEHHFEDYSFCPDNFVYLAHIAALTRRIRLATGAVILPWNIQPLRVAEKAALLDTLSGGRLILGMGRGLSRREFSQFGVAMDESRDRFDEMAPMILDALETGVMEEHHGRYFDQPRAVLRPRPFKSFRDRTTQVAMSSDSVQVAAKLGAQMMSFLYKPDDVHKAEFDTYRAAFRQQHGKAPKAPLLALMTICDSDAERARENAERHCAMYFPLGHASLRNDERALRQDQGLCRVRCRSRGNAGRRARRHGPWLCGPAVVGYAGPDPAQAGGAPRYDG